jgi:hypothetical protein
MCFRIIAGVLTVSAEKMTVDKLKQGQRLESSKHITDGTAFILLSSLYDLCTE